jgi:hypothetical protein
MAKVINPAVGGNIETIIYDSTHPLTWVDGGGDGTVNAAFPVTVAVNSVSGVEGSQDANSTETIDLTDFDTMIVDVDYQIDATGTTENNLGTLFIKVDGSTVFSFFVNANFETRNDRFVLDISALSANGIINIFVSANGIGTDDADSSLQLNEMKLINRAI